MRHWTVGVILLFGTFACLNAIKTGKYEKYYVGNFEEQTFAFFESFEHVTDVDYYYDLPYNLKISGLYPLRPDTIPSQGYNWLRDPENLLLAFNTALFIGLDNFVSQEQYNSSSPASCCDYEWTGATLNDIVKGFIQSDTNSVEDDYFSKFWKRRRKEGNLTAVHSIFTQIDTYYNGSTTEQKVTPIDTVLQNLLAFDFKLAKADSSTYPTVALEYFNFLKTVQLDYSAYKLIFHNQQLNFSKEMKDSLLRTIQHDTISMQEWEILNDNERGWIGWQGYNDPDRYYGP